MFSKRKLTSIALICVSIWILSSIYLTQWNGSSTDPMDLPYIPRIVSLDRDHKYLPNRMNIPNMLPEYIPDISHIIPTTHHHHSIPSSMHTIPSLFIISVPKSGSSSLIKWLVSTEEIFGDYGLAPHKVENNMLAKYYIDALITRNDSIGFYISDEQIMEFNDWRYISSFTEKPMKSFKMFESFHKHKRGRWRKPNGPDDEGMKRFRKPGRFRKHSYFSQLKDNGYLKDSDDDYESNYRSHGVLKRLSNVFTFRKLLGFEPEKMQMRRFKMRRSRRDRKKVRMRYNANKDLDYVERNSFILSSSAKQTYHTVGKSVFYFHLPYMARVFAIKYPNTKILITIRNPIARLKSNFLFFIGDEYKRLPQKYGNVNVYLTHIMNHKLLKQPFEEIKSHLTELNAGNDTFVNVTKWYDIYRAYKVFLVNMIRVCQKEFTEMGKKRWDIMESCKENDLIRSAFATSCYIVPIMYWYMINLNVKRNFRLLQAELLFETPNEYVSRILCWVHMDNENCKAWDDKEWKTQKQWRQSEAKRDQDDDINMELKVKIKEELSQCNVALTRFVESNPAIQISPFDLSLWK